MKPEDYKEQLDKAKWMVENGKDEKEIREYLRTQKIFASKAQVRTFIKFVKRDKTKQK